jgi:hypothetical protein
VDYEPATIFAGLVVSSFGVGLFIYGKKQRRAPQFVAGVLLSVLAIFANGALATYGIAAAIFVAMWIAIRFGL